MEVGNIEQIIKLLKQYNLEEIYIENDNCKLKIVNNKMEVNKFDSDNIGVKERNYKLEKNNGNECIIKSPLVGYISILENENTKSSFKIGDKVKKGQVLCVIEAMKMLNEITSNKDGVISQIMFENNEFVEFEQPLFTIIEAV